MRGNGAAVQGRAPEPTRSARGLSWSGSAPALRPRPGVLSAALDRAAIAGSPSDLRRLAVWAARQAPVRAPWSDLLALAEDALEGRASADDLAALHAHRSGAACAATVCGLSKGVATAAADLTAFGAAHPDPSIAARQAIQNAYAWHALHPDADAEAFAAHAMREAGRLSHDTR